jgi:hypothetical protein
MSFECADLDQALRAPELPVDAKIHAQTCESCRERIELWSAISDVAPQLHEEWESPALWPRIQGRLEAISTYSSRSAAIWRYALAAAVALLIAVGIYRFWPAPHSTSHPEQSAFLTAQTLRDVQDAEAVYLQAIERLSAAAGPTLQESPTPLAGIYREKLSLLDSAIADLKAGVDRNRYNAYLQAQLASLYQAKQKTLEEWLQNAKSN